MAIKIKVKEKNLRGKLKKKWINKIYSDIKNS